MRRVILEFQDIAHAHAWHQLGAIEAVAYIIAAEETGPLWESNGGLDIGWLKATQPDLVARRRYRPIPNWLAR